MFFYLVLYFTATLCAYCYAKARTSAGIWLCKTFLFLILFLPLALRYNIGTDYPNYVDFIKDEYFFKHNYLFFEPGWAPIIYAIDKWNLSLQWFFVVPAFFSTLIVLNEDVMERKYAHFCIPAYISIAYIRSFTAVRQLFAATIFLLCIKHFEQKEYGKMLFWLIIAFLFHKSAIILLPILILASFDWKKLNQYKALTIYAIIVVVFVMYNAATYIMDTLVSDTPYAMYITDNTWNRQSEFRSGLGALTKQLLCILILFSIRKEEIDGATDVSTKQYNIVCMGTLCLAAFQILMTQIVIFARLVDLFSPFYIYIAACLIKSKWKYRQWACFAFLSILFILFYKTLTTSHMGEEGYNIIPYQSILTTK